MINKCLELYECQEEHWVMVRPKDKVWEPYIAVGSAGYEGAGNFKIHVSIDPAQMRQAIPIILDHLYQEGAPRVGLKFQTSGLVSSGIHQTGKEFAIIFSQEAERDEAVSHNVGKLLAKIQQSLIAGGILPEKGLVLTVATREQIACLPNGVQPSEKANIQARKYDRQITGSPYFFYRNDKYVAVDDTTEQWVLEMTPAELRAQNIFKFSEFDAVLAKRPENMHNPRGEPDPWVNINLG